MVIVAMKTVKGLPMNSVTVYEDFDYAKQEIFDYMKRNQFGLCMLSKNFEVYESYDTDVTEVEVRYTQTAGGTHFTLRDLGLE